jgi:RNA polymerase sigma-70 factor (ECF subfamily)
LSDAELVLALKRRDPEVGELLYDRLIRVIEWTALRVVGVRGPEHEDLVQSAFEQVVKTVHSGSFRQTCALTSWASSITCNLALTAVRKRKRDHLLLPVEELAAAPSHDNPEASLHAREQLQRLRLELASMNPDRAAAVVLCDVNGLDLRELASVLGISVAAAQSRLSRGRSELARRMPDVEWRES